MKNNIEVELTLPALTNVNFDLVKSELSADLEKYKNVLVTTETLADDKKLAQTISGKAKEFAKIRKDKVTEISAPIVAFQDQMKELEAMCTNLSTSIKSQVKVFEDEKLEEIGKLLKKSLEVMRTDAGISFMFRADKASDSLIKLGAVTKSGALTKGSKDSLFAIVNGEKSIMQTTELRLAQLESECLKAGLEVILTKVNVEQFLFDTDENYSAHLVRVINAQFEQEQAAKTRKANLASKLNKPVEQATKVPAQPKPADQIQQPSSDGKVSYTATAIFKLRVSSQITEQQIAVKLKKMMADTGITSLHSVGVIKDA